MRFSEKIRKVCDPAAGLSFKRAVRRIARPLSIARFLAKIDQEKLQNLKRTYGVTGSVDWPKYVEAERFLKLNIRRAQDLGLDHMPPQRIFDLGSGAGYFLFVARELGHSGLGLDFHESLFGEMFELFGLERIIHRIRKFQPLPETGARFDWITAFSVCFADNMKNTPWDVEEWDYFLRDLDKHLASGGRIYLDLNPRPDGSFYSSGVRELFLDRGAVIDRRSKLLFPPKSLTS